MEQTRYTLIERLKDQQNEAAWQTFSSTYEAYIYVVLKRLGVTHEEAVDLRQDILLKLWKKLPTFDYQPEKAKFRTWLCQVIRNTAFTYLSSKNSEKARIDLYFSEENNPANKESKLDSIMDEEWRSYISNTAMEALREKFNAQSIEIFERSLEGAKAPELAAEYNLQENTIYRIKNRVKERLIVEIARLRKELE
ncbi:RNA polymerase sigma factor [Rubritalea tangerina]|uniref:RNA polymerase sigma factor n=1 Tax=Rubritalea tangerina TaxID=430798 RepID=A0ABW4Z9E9_9BACT